MHRRAAPVLLALGLLCAPARPAGAARCTVREAEATAATPAPRARRRGRQGPRSAPLSLDPRLEDLRGSLPAGRFAALRLVSLQEVTVGPGASPKIGLRIARALDLTYLARLLVHDGHERFRLRLRLRVEPGPGAPLIDRLTVLEEEAEPWVEILTLPRPAGPVTLVLAIACHTAEAAAGG